MAEKDWGRSVKRVFVGAAVCGVGYFLVQPSIEEHQEKADTYAAALELTARDVAANNGSPKDIDLSHYSRQAGYYTSAETARDDVAYDGWAFPGSASARLKANAACVAATSANITWPAEAIHQRSEAIGYGNDNDPRATAAYNAMGAACMKALDIPAKQPGKALNLIVDLIQD